MTEGLPRADHFSRNLYISLGVHGLLLVLIFLRAVFVPSEPIEIRHAIRVDVVDLPQKMTEPQTLSPPAAKPAEPVKVEPAKPEPVAKETPKPEPAKPKTVDLSKPKPDAKKSQKAALDKLKAMSALDKMKNEVAKENAAKEAAREAAKEAAKPAQVVRGNQVSAGNSLSGLDKIEYDRYFDDFEGKIRANWSIPQWLADSPLKAQVQVLIDERGYVIKKVMRRSSGNESFDAKVFEAIDNSSPLPVPPKRLTGMLSTSGIILNFPE